MAANNQGEQSPTDKAERTRRLAADRQERFRAAKPEVRGIYAPAGEHAEIKALVRGWRKRRAHKGA